MTKEIIPESELLYILGCMQDTMKVINTSSLSVILSTYSRNRSDADTKYLNEIVSPFVEEKVNKYVNEKILKKNKEEFFNKKLLYADLELTDKGSDFVTINTRKLRDNTKNKINEKVELHHRAMRRMHNRMLKPIYR